MIASAHDVARELRRREPQIGVVKLHKLLYYCQGWHVAWFGSPLFAEPIRAWANGPVVADLWRAEKHGDTPSPAPRALDAAALGTIDYVLGRYGRLTGRQLIDLTHQEIPWREKSELDGDWYDDEIQYETMAEFFRSDEEAAHLGALFAHAWANPDVRTEIKAAREQSVHTPDDPQEIARRLRHLSRR